MNKDRIIGGLLVGLGTAMTVLGVMNSSYMGQRILYVVAGLAFVVAGMYRLGKRPAQGKDPRGGPGTT